MLWSVTWTEGLVWFRSLRFGVLVRTWSYSCWFGDSVVGSYSQWGVGRWRLFGGILLTWLILWNGWAWVSFLIGRLLLIWLFSFRYSYELRALVGGISLLMLFGEGLRVYWGLLLIMGTLLSCVGMSLFLPLPLSSLLVVGLWLRYFGDLWDIDIGVVQRRYDLDLGIT